MDAASTCGWPYLGIDGAVLARRHFDALVLLREVVGASPDSAR